MSFLQCKNGLKFDEHKNGGNFLRDFTIGLNSSVFFYWVPYHIRYPVKENYITTLKITLAMAIYAIMAILGRYGSYCYGQWQLQGGHHGYPAQEH